MKNIVRIPVKFSELDPMFRVWHGNYVKYFEDGREAFGKEFPGCDYGIMMQTGITAPIYDLKIKYLAPLSMNDVAVIHTKYVPKHGARLDYKYEIYRESDGMLCCTGSTTQLFIDPQGNQLLEEPDFYLEWKKKNSL